MKFSQSNPPVSLLQWPKASPTLYLQWRPATTAAGALQRKFVQPPSYIPLTLKSSHVLFIQISTCSIYLNIPVATTAAGALQRKFPQPPLYIPGTLKSSRVLFIQISTREKY